MMNSDVCSDRVSSDDSRATLMFDVSIYGSISKEIDVLLSASLPDDI